MATRGESNADYDFCIVFPAEDGEFDARGKRYVQSLKKLGFEMYAYSGVRENQEIFVLLRTPLAKLRAFADIIDFKMKLDGEVVQHLLEKGDSEASIAPVVIAHRPDITPYLPYQHIYAKYSRKVSESLYLREDGYEHPFSDIVRLKLSALLLEMRVDGAQNLKIRRYIRNGWLLGCYPLHDKTKKDAIWRNWNQYPFKALPLTQFKDYFGEKNALYFAFMEHFVSFLSLPAIVGVPLQIAVFATGDYSAPFLPYFSLFIALWAVCMLEFWKRKEKSIALEWGTIDFESNEVDRADFRGDEIDSFIDGSRVRHFPSVTRRTYVLQSVVSVVSLILLVVGVVVSIYVIRYTITGDVGPGNAQLVASISNAIQIQVMNFIYSFIANALSERENHRTDTEFEDSMITKIFLFQFVNSYASFFYLAFIAESMGDCSGSGCMSGLTINLATIFGTRLFVGNVMELLLPYVSYLYKYREEVKKATGEMSQPESEYLLDKYDQMSSSLEDYAEVAIGFGYTALFVSALPMAAALAFVSNAVEIKADGWKLLTLHQRPFPKGCEDVGSWQTIFLMLAVAAVLTNAGLIAFTMDVLDAYSESTKFWIFIGFQWICFSMQAIIMEAIPDCPEEIDIQLQRTEFIARKLVDKVADDHDDDVLGEEEALLIHKHHADGSGGGTYGMASRA